MNHSGSQSSPEGAVWESNRGPQSDGEERPGVRKRGEMTILRLDKPQQPGSNYRTARE